MTVKRAADLELREHHAKVLERMRQAREEELKAEEAMEPRSDEARDLRRELHGRLCKALGLDVANAEETLRGMTEREIARGNQFRRISKWEWMNKDYPPPPAPPPVPLDHAFWWVVTTPHVTRGIDSNWDGDELQFFGQHWHNSDKNIKWHIAAVADYWMSPGRLPPSLSGRWRSEPAVDLSGWLEAYTGLQGWWSPDDKWCKCNLAIRQTIYQAPPGFFAPLGEKWERIPLINEENKFRWQPAQCPGFQVMPRLDFAIVYPGQDIYAQLEVRFEVEQEGDSVMRFGRTPYGAGRPANAVRYDRVNLMMHQWSVTAA